ncbi:unnamed protein product [Rotaria sp. Silwood1]|nr:unnamed protein product [Rotaria sp. Silwood1]CAF0740577.1 unnamed protein product [Rotaria sp. Silwood1]CAF3349675.1 unnamed protein product [Rotaria sp. Silwood1]CAF4636241.1 unnamed protein product [Rotaria sp. Silwood1]
MFSDGRSFLPLSKASLYGIFNIFTVDFNDDSYKNFHDNNNYINCTDESHVLLENFSYHEFELLNTQLKIFFVQTSENEDILSRHACSIESAARLHTTGLIFVFMRSQYIHLRKGSFNRLRTYTNIRFVHFNEYDIYSGTTLSRLNETKRTQVIRYFAISHMSDFIRTALLYKYGGIYFDLDVIPLKTFSLFSNTVALESVDSVNVAVLVFEKQHIALDIQMDIQLTSVNTQFNAFCWNCVGPSALSDALKRVCDDKKLHIHSRDKCQKIDIQPSFVFYPIAYQKIPQFFRHSKSFDDIDYLIKNSSIYSIHYFHHMTMNLPVENLSPFARIAQIYCPKVYEQLIDRKESILKRTQTSKYLFTNLNIVLFCLSISFLCILILFLAGTFLSYLTSMRVVILELQHKFNITI